MKTTNRILAIDDDPDILRVLRANLELNGFEVDTASNCQEAEDRLNEGLPDLIILDLILPDGDGVEFCRKLRTEFQIPVIMLTARDRVSDKVIGLESGADDYIVKPFETLELIARIKACLRRYRPEGDSMLKAGDITLNYNTRTVEVRGKEVYLTPKEFDFLALLMENKGKVLTRNFIKKSLWKGTQIYSWSRVIDVHIQHLRRKIEKDPSNPQHILTIPGVGYKFNE